MTDSVCNPRLHFKYDWDTGFYQKAPRLIGFVVDGIERAEYAWTLTDHDHIHDLMAKFGCMAILRKHKGTRPFNLTPMEDNAMKQRLDGKFQGTVYKNKNGKVVPPDEWMVFLCKDNAFPATLRFYLEECKRQGAEAEQLDAVKEAIERMEDWRRDNPKRLKTPDVPRADGPTPFQMGDLHWRSANRPLRGIQEGTAMATAQH